MNRSLLVCVCVSALLFEIWMPTRKRERERENEDEDGNGKVTHEKWARVRVGQNG